jgi:CheY-like chemotaxis protein
MDVLLVEDEDLVREVLSDGLEESGLSVVAVPSAETALSVAAEEEPPPAVLVTDVNLGPGMDGLALADQAHHVWPGVAVVVMTGDERNLLNRPGRSRERHLLKPFDAARLRSEITDLMGGALRAT